MAEIYKISKICDAGINGDGGFKRLGMTGKEYVQEIFDKLYHLIHSN